MGVVESNIGYRLNSMIGVVQLLSEYLRLYVVPPSQQNAAISGVSVSVIQHLRICADYAVARCPSIRLSVCRTPVFCRND